MVCNVRVLRPVAKFQHANRQGPLELVENHLRLRETAFACKHGEVIPESLIQQFDSAVRQRDLRLQGEMTCQPGAAQAPAFQRSFPVDGFQERAAGRPAEVRRAQEQIVPEEGNDAISSLDQAAEEDRTPDDLAHVRAPLLKVVVEDAGIRITGKHQVQPPRQGMCVAYASAQPLAKKRGHLMCRIARQNDPSRQPTSGAKAMKVVASDANDVDSVEIDERAELLADEGGVGRLLNALSIRHHHFPSVVGTCQGNVSGRLMWIADLCMVGWQALVFFARTSSCVDDHPALVEVGRIERDACRLANKAAATVTSDQELRFYPHTLSRWAVPAGDDSICRLCNLIHRNAVERLNSRVAFQSFAEVPLERWLVEPPG